MSNITRKTISAILDDPLYVENIQYGKPRKGHPEGSVSAHIQELLNNLDKLDNKVDISMDDYYKLEFLVHVHDTFKGAAEKGVPITHPKSHASLARGFASFYTQDDDLLNMIQYHDEGFAIWRKVVIEGKPLPARFFNLIKLIKDWDLFLTFNIIDACTDGKDREVIEWFIDTVKEHVETKVDSSWILY